MGAADIAALFFKDLWARRFDALPASTPNEQTPRKRPDRSLSAYRTVVSCG